jgi:hypothetical protein
MPDQPPAGLEEPLLETRQGPAPDGDGKDEPSQQIAEVVRDDAQEQAHLVGSEAVAGEPGGALRQRGTLEGRVSCGCWAIVARCVESRQSENVGSSA